MRTKSPYWLSLLSVTTDIYLHALALLHNNYCDDVHRLRVQTQPCGVIKIDAAPGVIQITIKPNPPIDPMAIIGLIQKNNHIKLAGKNKIRIERELPDLKARAQMVRDVLRNLGTPKAEPAAALA